MALSVNARNALTHGVADYNAAQEIITAINSATTGVAAQDIATTASPTFVGLTLTGNETVGGTLGVTGASTLAGAISATKASGTGLAVTANQTIGGTLAVTGTSAFTGAATFTADTNLNGNALLASGKVLKINNVQVVGAQQALVPAIVTTYTTGSAPTPGYTQTIADAATPTVVELLQYCANLDGRLSAINIILKTHGLEASA